MKFGKKILTALLVLTLTLCAVGCGKKETTDNTEAVATSEDAASPEDADGGDYIPLPVGSSSEDTAVEADVFVEKIDNLSEDFITGADLSSIAAEFDSGVKYYDFDGNELDEQGFFDFLYNDCEVNYVRIRVWVDPYDEDGNSYGGGNNDIETAKRIGTWATNAGMRVLIDFHYSDFWADPSKQRAPKEWEDLSVDEKAVALRMYTEDSLNELINAGVDVGMVQIGNET
ncbi:MAG: glycosyl hydrolase 53 family protein, partial [Lachnospiraceae bacterium]|nr:glycosyl hydrolase 53 family protein [Lachnospiraceae bacterium]